MLAFDGKAEFPQLVNLILAVLLLVVAVKYVFELHKPFGLPLNDQVSYLSTRLKGY